MTKQASVTMGVKTTGGVNVVTENAVTIVSMTPVMRRMDDVNLDVRVATGESCVPSGLPRQQSKAHRVTDG